MPHPSGANPLSRSPARAALAAAFLLATPAALAQDAAPRTPAPRTPALQTPAPQTATPCAPGDAPANQTRLLVDVTGAKPVAGNITFTLYGANPQAFLAHHGSIALTRVTLASPEAEACFALSAPGTYAVAVYHDANNNHRFDRTLLGLPAEGYGFSNNVVPLILPSFSSVRIAVPAGESRIAIRLIY